jgi:hypothetical protein
MEPKKTPYIHFQPSKDGNQLAITWRVIILRTKNEAGNLSCYAPGYDIYFGAKSAEDSRKKALILSKFFIDNYLIHTKNGLKKLILQLHTMGFKAPNNTDAIYKLINSKFVHAKFSSQLNKVPANFADAVEEMHENKMTVAV